MTITPEPAPPAAATAPPGPPRRRVVRRVVVSSTARISPSFQRIVLTGQMLASFDLPRPACHLKLVLPDEGERDVRLIEGEDGLELPAGDDRPVLRTYTARAWDPQRLELTVDVALHEHAGPAARWATTCVPGDRLAIVGPGGGYDPDEAVPLVLVGDETALPAIATILEASTRDDATAILEVPTAADAEVVAASVGTKVTVLARDAGDPSLSEALVGYPLPVHGAVWVAAEAAVIRGIRRDLLATGRVDPERLTTRGYWRRGTVNHPDHDHGLDELE